MSIDAILSKIDEIAYTDKFALNWADDFSSAVSENDMLERLGLSEDDMKDYSEQERKEHILGAAKDTCSAVTYFESAKLRKAAINLIVMKTLVG